MDSLSVKIDRLALGAETPLADIIKLEELLEKIQVTISSYTSQKNFDKVNTLSDLWEALGENRVTHMRMNGNRRLLQGMNGFQNSTLSYITSALRTLQRAKRMLESFDGVWPVAIPEMDGERTSMINHENNLKEGLEHLQEMQRQVVKRRGRAIALKDKDKGKEPYVPQVSS